MLLIKKKISHICKEDKKSIRLVYRKEISVIEPKSERCAGGEK